MRIAIACHGQAGGSGIVASELAMALGRRGHEVAVVAVERPLRLRETPGVTHHTFEIPDYPLFRFPPHDLCLITKLAEVVAERRIEIIHAHYAIPHALAAIAAQKIVEPHPVAVVTTLHGTDVTLVGSHPSFYSLTRYAMDRSDGLTAVSSWLRDRTVAAFNLSRAPAVIPNFVDGGLFHPIDRAPYPKGGEFELVHVSNFRPVKRVTDIIRAFDMIRQKVPARLTLVGTGPELGSARELVAELGLAGAVRFEGLVRTLPPLLRTAHLALLLSDFESFGVSALEALACGVPVVASHAGGLPEVVRSEETGLLCAVGDYRCAAESALAILTDPAAWERMSRQAAADARTRFDVEKVVPRYEAYYEEVLGACGR